MSKLAAPLAVVIALLGALGPLLLLADSARAWGFRGYVAIVGFVALRSAVRRIDAAGESHPDGPNHDLFHVPRRTPRQLRHLSELVRAVRHRHRPRFVGTAALVNAGIATAGGAHHRLRPLLIAVAEERLRAHHGTTLDGPEAERLFRPEVWEVLRPERPAPKDRLARGLPPDTIAAILDDLEDC